MPALGLDASKENVHPFTPRAAHKGGVGLGARTERGTATPGGGLQPHQGLTPQRRPAQAAVATPSQPVAGESTVAGGSAAETLAWARKLALERAACEQLPREQRHERLARLYQQATQAIGAVRGGEGAQIWLEYAQLQAYAASAPHPVPAEASPSPPLSHPNPETTANVCCVPGLPPARGAGRRTPRRGVTYSST